MAIAAAYGIFAGFYYWIGKMSGYQYPEFWGKLHFWSFFIGTNIVFFPMHFLGAQGMPRRYPDYPDAFWGWHAVSSAGAVIAWASMFFFVYAIWLTFRRRVSAGANPWGEGATTLEWQVSSPPPFHTFDELPRIR
jgi:cytochrome c oxidase subunit 1